MADRDPAVALPAWLGRRTQPSALDRAPAIMEVMSAAAESWAGRFTELSGTPVEMRCTGLRMTGLANLLRDRGGTPTCAVLQAPEWTAEIGMVIDRALIAVLVEALFGGEGEGADNVTTGLSPVETQIAGLLGQQIAEALDLGLSSKLRLAVTFDRLLAKPEFGTLGKGDQPVASLTFAVSALGGSGECELLFPVALLASLADGLGSEVPAAPAEHDPRWARQLGGEVGRAMTDLKASIELAHMNLGAVLALKPGQVLTLPPAAGSRVRLSCGSSDLFRCDLGQQAGQYTVRIEETLAGIAGSERGLPFNLATQQ